MRLQRGIADAWLILIALAIVLGLLGWVYHAIDSRAYTRGKAEITQAWEKANREQRDKEAKQTASAAGKVEDGNAKARVVYRTITQTVDRVVDRPVYRNLCLDDDGLRIAATAINGSTEPAAPVPDKPVPKPAATTGRDRGVRLALDRGGF